MAGLMGLHEPSRSAIAAVPLMIEPMAEPRPVLAYVRGSREDLEKGVEQWLPLPDLEYLNTLSADRRRHSFLLGRRAAYKALAASGARDGVTIERGVFTQPVVVSEGRPSLDVSISHAHETGVGLAFPRVFPMAIDIETIDPARHDVMRGQMTDAELEKLSEIECGFDRSVRLTILWCAKEALSKALGCGMTCPMKVMEVDDLAVSDYGVTGTYQNFFQYRFHAMLFGHRQVLAIVMHRHHRLQTGALP